MNKDREEKKSGVKPIVRNLNIPESVMNLHIKEVNRLAREVRGMAMQQIAPWAVEAEKNGAVIVTDYDLFVEKHFVAGEINRVRFWLDLLKGIPFEDYEKKYKYHILVTEEDVRKYRRWW